MTRLSLTARLSLMFMLAVTGVLAAAGFFFNQLSQHHFDELDSHTLAEKLQASRGILGSLDELARFDSLQPQLQALLGGHSELVAYIFDDDGRLYPPREEAPHVSQTLLQLATEEDGELHEDGRVWRSKAARVEVAGLPLNVLLLLDVTVHRAFLHSLGGWLWVALVLCALVSALLGWLLVRSGLRPLREVTQVAASVSARSLTERIPLESAPAELAQLVLAVNAMLDRLEEAFVRLSNFSADIAHELRTPLSNLMTHTEVVLSRARGVEDYQDNLYSNLEELQRMSRMIDDMLFLAKADNGLIVPERHCVDLRLLCAQLLEFYQLAAEERGVRLQLSGEGSLQGEPRMLHRALSNLLSNALRYTPDGQAIRVQIEAGDDGVQLCVANPGETIAAEHLERVFDRFYRVDPARREGSPSNAGLGLAIARSIIEAHQGRIRCTSEQGMTRFILEFPR
jgi:two-component system heavy metal sensor histidine kinase CusS